MSKAEEAAMKAYPIRMVSGPIGYEDPPFDLNAFARSFYEEGYEHAEEDIILIIQSRIDEILGDAQPKPALRAELQELITRIK